MSEQPASRTSVLGMSGHGFYNAHSAPQLTAQMAVVPWLADELATGLVLDRPLEPVVLADFGCSEGGNSIIGMRVLVGAVRSVSPRPIQTVHSDLPTNDFNTLMRRLDASDHSLYGSDAVFPSAVAGSMFDQLLAPGTVTAATTFNAVGYLSRRPAIGLAGYLLPNGPSRERSNAWVTEEERQAFVAQSEADLVAFYQARWTELVPGGLLLIQCWGRNEETCGCYGIFDALHGAMMRLVERGRVDGALVEGFVDPAWFRSFAETMAPFRERTSPLSEKFAVRRAGTQIVPVPFVQEFERSGDLGAYVAGFCGYLRAFGEPPIRLNFGAIDELDQIIDEIFDEVAALVRAEPAEYRYQFVSVAALLEKL